MDSADSAINRWWNPASVFNRLLLSPTLAKRATATLLDFALISALQLGVSQTFGVYQPVGGEATAALVNGDGMTFYAGLTPTVAYLWLAVAIIAYFTFFEALFGASPGKALCKLRVVSLDGGRPTLRAILTRNVFRLVDALPLLYVVGGLVAQSTLHEQRVGDILAGTTVAPRDQATGGHTQREHARLSLKLALAALVVVALLAGAIAYQYFARPPLIIQSWANAHNAQSGFVAASTGATGAPPTDCGPMPAWPYAPASTASDARPIIQYALGAPQWSAGEVIYPMRELVWDSATDSGAPPSTPMQVSMALLGTGPDVYSGHIIFSDFNPLNGGWWIQGGDMSCTPAK